MATQTIKIKANWQEGETATRIKAGSYEFFMDRPAKMGGSNLGPTPVQYLLACLPGCLASVGRMVAEEMGIALHSLVLTVEGDFDQDGHHGVEGVRNGFSAIRVGVKVAADASQVELERWLSLTHARCPVADNLENATQLSLTLDTQVKT
ncbi:MAG: OsmC family protein [Planctomycetota bacterium]|jgi:uncharacterized OsmC-like protein|nr:OsmC family protein [Planctomycetota bacterium]